MQLPRKQRQEGGESGRQLHKPSWALRSISTIYLQENNKEDPRELRFGNFVFRILIAH